MTCATTTRARLEEYTAHRPSACRRRCASPGGQGFFVLTAFKWRLCLQKAKEDVKAAGVCCAAATIFRACLSAHGASPSLLHQDQVKERDDQVKEKLKS